MAPSHIVMRLGPYVLPNPLFVAPMAGVTDRPFRQLCRAFCAGYAVSDMVTARPELWRSLKTSRRADHTGEPAPVAVQIAGTDAAMMAEAAAYNVDRGAQIMDINMSCPAKKVCAKWAGSALMRDESLALSIIDAVVAVCAPRGVPVTLKVRTGWSAAERNAVRLARAAEHSGVQMVVIHGRTREQGYTGAAEYETVAAAKAALHIPVVASGDITTPEQAARVFRSTGVDAIMVGRAAQGRPWLFREIAHFLATGQHLAPPLVLEVRRAMLEHLQDHYALYGECTGVRSARKHIGWYLRDVPGGDVFRRQMNTIQDTATQWRAVADFFAELAKRHERLPRRDVALRAQSSRQAERARP